MGVSARALSSLLLAVLLTSSPGALGANPGLVVRITDKGLEYGKKRWLSAGLADPLGTRLLWVRRGTDRALFFGPRGLSGQPALARTLASSPNCCVTQAPTHLSWGSCQPTETRIWVRVVDLGDASRTHHGGEEM